MDAEVAAVSPVVIGAEDEALAAGTVGEKTTEGKKEEGETERVTEMAMEGEEKIVLVARDHGSGEDESVAVAPDGEDEYVEVEADEGDDGDEQSEGGEGNAVSATSSSPSSASSSSDEAADEAEVRGDHDDDGDDEGEEDDEKEEDNSEEEDSAEGEFEEIVILTCVLNQPSHLHKGRKIWRRIAVPAEFSLLELHVALQNAFDWEDAHLHSFCQPRQNPYPNLLISRASYGRTDASSLLSLDLDSLEASQVRTYQSVLGIEDAAYDEVLVPAEPDNKEGSVVFIQYPLLEELVAGESGQGTGQPLTGTVVKAGIKQVMEERAFRVGDIFSDKHPILMYEYDFGESHEITITYGGKYLSTEGVNFPTCLAGAGASRVEDGNDMDDDGNLLPDYNYDEFAVLEVIHKFEKTYAGLWPAGPGAEDQKQTSICYMCRYSRECGNRACHGRCCDYCLKSSVARGSGRITLAEADCFFKEAEAVVVNDETVAFPPAKSSMEECP